MTPQLIGAYVACLEHGHDPMVIERAFESTKSASADYDHRVFRPLIKLACMLMDTTDDTSIEANVFRKAYADTEKSASWTPLHTKLATEFAACLDADSVKTAGVLDSIPALAAGGGLGAAALYFLLNRDATQESESAEQTRAARDIYNQLAVRAKRRTARLMGRDEDAPDVPTAPSHFSNAHAAIDQI